jgi:uncharacterized protein (TIGR00369 family)
MAQDGEGAIDLKALAQAHEGTLAAFLGVRFVSAHAGEVVCALAMRPELTTVGGGVHGGVLMAFADIAGAACAALNLKPGHRTSTFQSASNMVGSIREGEMLATAVPVHLGSRTMVILTRVTEAATGRLLCQTSQTQMTLVAG